MKRALLSLMLLLSAPVATAQETSAPTEGAVIAGDDAQEGAAPEGVPTLEGTAPEGAAPGDASSEDADSEGAVAPGSGDDTAADEAPSSEGALDVEAPELVSEPLTGAPPERPEVDPPDYGPAEEGVPPLLTLPPAAVTVEVPEEAGQPADAAGEHATGGGEDSSEGIDAPPPAEAEQGSEQGADQGHGEDVGDGAPPHGARTDGASEPDQDATEEANTESLTVFEALSHSMLTRHGAVQAVRLGFLALFFLLLSLILERQLRRLAPSGLFPGVVRSLAILSRGAFVPLVLLSIFALTPRSWGWVEPLVVVVIAVAAGWASREVLTDIFAGMVLTIERPFHEGQRVRIGEIEGEVSKQGLRLTWLRTDDGRMVALPNRRVTREGWTVEPDAFAPIQVRLYVDPDLPARAVREVLEEATLASPWLATQHTPVVYRAPEELHLWIIEGRLVHPRYAGAFKGSLVELSEERLAQLAATRPRGTRGSDKAPRG